MGKALNRESKSKDLRFYGRIYHWLLDPPLAEARQVAAGLIPPGATVLDIACGTGLLCAALAEKGCHVTGLDLSRRMVRYAETHRRSDEVKFILGDAADLSAFADQEFDFATLLFLLHELPHETRRRVLAEALRVAGRALIIDSVSPLPQNPGGRGIRSVEATFGRDHYYHFKSFLAGGGIPGLLGAAGTPVTVHYRAVFWRGCRQVIIVSKAPQS